METITEAVTQLIVGAISSDHWPWFSVTIILAVVGQIMSRRVFTRDRAYRFWGKDWRARALHFFWHYGRESMPAHPFLVALLIVLPLWPDPEGKHWRAVETGNYWLFSATCSLFAWIVIKAIAKEKGIMLELPGDSLRPTSLLPGPPDNDTISAEVLSKASDPTKDQDEHEKTD